MSVFSVESPPPILGLGEDSEEDKLPNDGYVLCISFLGSNLASMI